jgi:uncharacterized membrane protein
LDTDTEATKPKKPAPSIRRSFGRRFLLGLAAILPLSLTVFVLWFLVTRFGGLLAGLFAQIPYLDRLPDIATAILGFFALVFLIYVIGFLATSILGRWFVRLSENALVRVPLVRTIYSSSKQLVETLFVDKSAFRKVVMVEFPKKGNYALGFVTTYDGWKIGPSELRAFPVFIPTTPNPTSGYLLFVPETELIDTDLTVEWAMKVIISGGIVSPEVREIRADSC